MGYEILYKYHERQEDGKYNTEEIKEMKKKVGNPTDEVSLGHLASVIRAQLARRKIWIVDVEIYEFTKKKLSFKEGDDGSIIIKNKKFSPNNASTDLDVYESDDDEAPAGGLQPHELLAQAQAQGLQPHELVALRNKGQAPQVQQTVIPTQPSQRSVQYWVFDPAPHILAQLKQAGLKMTSGKTYAIHQIDSPSPAQALLGATQTFHVDDDFGRRKKLPSEHFVTISQGRLVGDNEVEGGFSQPVSRAKEPRLSFANSFIEDQKTSDMPDLRGRGRQAPAMPQVDPRLAGIDPREAAYGESYDDDSYMDEMPDIRAGR